MKIVFSDLDEKVKAFRAVDTTTATVVVAVVILIINLSSSCEVFLMKEDGLACEEKNIFEHYHSLTILCHPM